MTSEANSMKSSDKSVAELLAGKKAPEAAKSAPATDFPDADQFMNATYYGTYAVSHPDRMDKRMEKRFRVTVVAPKSLLTTNMNFHAFFKHTFTADFKANDPDFIRFQNVCFDKALNLDGTEIKDPRTFSLERLKKHCEDQGWNIDFRLYSGLKLRDVVFQYFLRPDKKDESEAFYAKQEAERRLHGLSAELKSAISVVPEAARIKFEEV
jgi:hypothetical protein